MGCVAHVPGATRYPLPYLTFPCLVLPCRTLPCLTLPCLTLPFLALPHLNWDMSRMCRVPQGTRLLYLPGDREAQYPVLQVLTDIHIQTYSHTDMHTYTDTYNHTAYLIPINTILYRYMCRYLVLHVLADRHAHTDMHTCIDTCVGASTLGSGRWHTHTKLIVTDSN